MKSRRNKLVVIGVCRYCKSRIYKDKDSGEIMWPDVDCFCEIRKRRHGRYKNPEQPELDIVDKFKQSTLGNIDWIELEYDE